ncbi:hypothetical protein L228DRAFT_128908 [Xylona heveae TC161]|uniref:Uncharacterized protein n=1 Tax=Xylona heveae (strain CBS 132557 / TC161) TaxID=1328760 RepID=A0A165GTF2_XYLHT|nr:hypothetical protein L228DRAFT_128908 [Xylona heveae TC161]KZF22574.1 hypothetical protein L228DRAFT_128908 [Xylona heveae TC161]
MGLTNGREEATAVTDIESQQQQHPHPHVQPASPPKPVKPARSRTEPSLKLILSSPSPELKGGADEKRSTSITVPTVAPVAEGPVSPTRSRDHHFEAASRKLQDIVASPGPVEMRLPPPTNLPHQGAPTLPPPDQLRNAPIDHFVSPVISENRLPISNADTLPRNPRMIEPIRPAMQPIALAPTPIPPMDYRQFPDPFLDRNFSPAHDRSAQALSYAPPPLMPLPRPQISRPRDIHPPPGSYHHAPSFQRYPTVEAAPHPPPPPPPPHQWAYWDDSDRPFFRGPPPPPLPLPPQDFVSPAKASYASPLSMQPAYPVGVVANAPPSAYVSQPPRPKRESRPILPAGRVQVPPAPAPRALSFSHYQPHVPGRTASLPPPPHGELPGVRPPTFREPFDHPPGLAEFRHRFAPETSAKRDR